MNVLLQYSPRGAQLDARNDRPAAPVQACTFTLVACMPSRIAVSLVAIALLAGAALLLMPMDSTGDDAAPPSSATAIFAGGCFWCMEADFEKLPGVGEVVSGYIGGSTESPTYKQVSRGATQHVEAVEINYDPSQVSFEELLDHFWVNIDPTVDDRQFCDTGRHYRPAIFYQGDAQQAAAEASRQAVIDAGEVSPIKVTVEPAGQFWVAETYHQDYYKKNPLRYNFYRRSCGRDARLEALWGKPKKEGP